MGINLGEKIRNYRKIKGLSQQELADKICASASSVGMYEQNRREPDLETLSKIAAALDISIDMLVSDVAVAASDELSEYLEELKNRSEMRTLFSLAKGATKEDVMKAVAIIEALKKTDG